ncbi:hypothetical protein BN7_478 [Wickerhamomyces ciferrii]|uniref:Uncharacterized protein n=1 Tax=Wickerhamomyces ciferrii (strain ATCC 14091 / BCRC 22168 / CBS 111 / JCM 3599 / NBRC 0793 / NRRL Y-1031 F-60-10) TaxID=1206466 RepID=K0KHT0_WICCF|nr:uncharacterized protein BN7_478 [Wickerhamomyces ciferrii]CCH40944.1 hypothetical protein BN7_478 [Wickerhamomyces ciferrii]
MPIHRQSEMRPINQGINTANININQDNHIDSNENIHYNHIDHIDHTNHQQQQLPHTHYPDYNMISNQDQIQNHYPLQYPLQYSNNDRFQRAMLTPLPPPPIHPQRDNHDNNDIHNTAPLPPRHLYRRGNFNQDLPSRSSTLSVNRDTGNVSYSTFTNDSIHLNNSILRRVIQPQSNFNHHQLINPSFANSNESHTIQNQNTNRNHSNNNNNNASTFNFLNDINRLSSQSLYNDLNHEQILEQQNHQRNLRNPLFQNHYDHSIPINLSRSTNLNLKFNEFLKYRREKGKLYNDYQIGNSKKRHIDDDHKPFDEFQFPITRCQPCSFIKSGFIFNLKNSKPNEIPFNLSFISINYNEHLIKGNFHFEHLYLMNHWLSEIAPNDNKIISNNNMNSFNFIGEIIDFEKKDLRFNSNFINNDINLNSNDENFRSNENLKLIYNDCIIKKQLQKWKFLKPFKNLKINDLISILNCNKCLTKLQENYILIKIFIDNDIQEDEEDKQPILLGCVDRKTGDIELISTQGRQKSIIEDYLNNNHNGNHHLNEDDLKFNNYSNNEEVIKLSMKCKKYVSPSLKFC